MLTQCQCNSDSDSDSDIDSDSNIDRKPYKLQHWFLVINFVQLVLL